jgi:hypothetical protein
LLASHPTPNPEGRDCVPSGPYSSICAVLVSLLRAYVSDSIILQVLKKTYSKIVASKILSTIIFFSSILKLHVVLMYIHSARAATYYTK